MQKEEMTTEQRQSEFSVNKGMIGLGAGLLVWGAAVFGGNGEVDKPKQKEPEAPIGFSILMMAAGAGLVAIGAMDDKAKEGQASYAEAEKKILQNKMKNSG